MSYRRVSQGGFTLVELILSLVIVSIIMLGLLTALRSFGITEDKLQRRVAAIDESRAVTSFLEDVLGRVAIRPPRPGSVQGAPDESVFVGTSTAVQWIGVMPARQGVGGMHHFRLFVADVDGAAALMIAFLPYAGTDPGLDWAQAEQRVLLRGLERIDLRYRLVGSNTWLSEWRNSGGPEQLSRVSVTLTVAGVEWPPLVVPARIPMPQGGRSVIVAGPS